MSSGASRRVELVKTAGEPRDFPGESLPEVAVIGRSNVGKSSLLNSLFGVKRMAFVSKTPGRTQVVNFYRVGPELMLVDLPGYGFARVPPAVRRRWDSLVTSYLFGRKALALVLLLIDARHGPMAIDIEVRNLLERAELPYLVVATKTDKLSKGRLRGEIGKLEAFYGASGNIPIIPFSAATNEGRNELWKTIVNYVREPRPAPRK
jgi:GTP-binding protein